eukprot:scpid42762/ scgid0963/ PIN2/TERF1-interacting telomerase inhibitor 1; 67-11-3 protein; LPTS1; Liver-related putative tumor suppressor; Pin2-interacting protein X1; TRF1-interacting protein 1
MAEVCLAERRKKQKWGSDPRGTNWSKDKSKFGYRMLEKMGWSDGSGLGAAEAGTTSHVKVNFKNDTLGLGTSTQHADDWIEHQSDFDGLLAALHQKQGASEPSSANQSGRSSPSAGLQAKAHKSRARINYNKFLRGKDISGYSNNDMSCILGVRATASEASSSRGGSPSGSDSDSSSTSNSDASSSSESDGEKEGSSSHRRQRHDKAEDASGIHTTTSGQSVQDYFAAKMAKLRQRQLPAGSIAATLSRSTGSSSIADSASARSDAHAAADTESIRPRKKKRKHADTLSPSDDDDNSTDVTSTATSSKQASGNESCDDEDDAPKPKKKKKKSKKGRKSSVIILIMLFMKEDTYVLLVDLSWMWFTYLKLMCIRDVV